MRTSRSRVAHWVSEFVSDAKLPKVQSCSVQAVTSHETRVTHDIAFRFAILTS